MVKTSKGEKVRIVRVGSANSNHASFVGKVGIVQRGGKNTAVIVFPDNSSASIYVDWLEKV